MSLFHDDYAKQVENYFWAGSRVSLDKAFRLENLVWLELKF